MIGDGGLGVAGWNAFLFLASLLTLLWLYRKRRQKES